MSSLATPVPGRTDSMKTKRTNGKPPRKTARITVGLPEDWYAIARRIATKRKQPVLYFLITALQAAFEDEGITSFPPAPWGEEGVA